MPRLRNVQSGAVVSCSDETAARLGSEWQPVEPKPFRFAVPEISPEDIDLTPAPKPTRRSRKSAK